MRMTTKGRYALRAAIALARMSQGEKPVSIKAISDAEGISPEFLEQIFFKLRKAGLVASVRGPGGGFYFAKSITDITLKDIVEASGEGVDMAACACGAGDAGDACDRVADCAAGAAWRDLAAYINAYLTKVTLKSLIAPRAKKAKRAEGALPADLLGVGEGL